MSAGTLKHSENNSVQADMGSYALIPSFIPPLREFGALGSGSEDTGKPVSVSSAKSQYEFFYPQNDKTSFLPNKSFS